MTTTTNAATAWKMPDLDTVYHIEEGYELTLRQMLDGLDPDMTPEDQGMLEDLLWAFGAWEDLAEMNTALAAREPHVTGFRLVK